MPMHRRDFIIAAACGAGLAALPGPVFALSVEEARAHVQGAVDEVLDLVRSNGSVPEKASRLRSILDRRAAVPQIARFAAGLAWRDMAADQQDRFTSAFAHYLATVYARRFQDYAGETITLGGVIDTGKRGLTVASSVSQPQGTPIAVDWLVSDRPGRIVIADIVIEGVSLLITQREEVGGMLEARGGDLERLIADLAAA